MARLAYSTHGEASQPAVVLFHGFMGSRHDWDALAPDLAQDLYCIAVDLPGHGETPIADDDDFVHTAAAVIEMMDDLDVATFAVAGYSMGGRLALYMATHYSMRVEALVCESASPGLQTEDERAARRTWEAEMAARLAGEDFRRFLGDWYDQPLFASLRAKPELVAETIARRMKNDPQQLAKAMVQFGTGSQPPLWGELDELYLPALFVAGELDQKYKSLARDMAAHSAEGRACIVLGAGHNVHAEQPDAYAAAVKEFLAAALRG